MFNAPEIIMNIKDIAEIYKINDSQEAELENAVETLENNIFLEKMGEQMIARWENMLQITPQDNDTVEDRRFRVKAKALERLPYSYRVLVRKLNVLCPEGHTMLISAAHDDIQIKLALTSKKMISDVTELLEEILPLNMTYNVQVMWNQHITLKSFTHKELSKYTHKQIREEVLSRVNENE